MTLTVTEALDLDTAEIVMVERSSGSFVDGLFVTTVQSTFKAMISVQQPTPKDLQMLPEGDRDADVRKFISAKVLRTSDDEAGILFDVVLYKSRRYKIVAVADWATFGHTTALGAKE